MPRHFAQAWLPEPAASCQQCLSSQARPVPALTSFLGQNDYGIDFCLMLMDREESWKHLQIEFCLSITVKSALHKPAGCHASQLCSWQICHVMSGLRENGKEETLPHTATLLGRMIWKPGFLHTLWLLSFKVLCLYALSRTIILLWSHLKNSTRSSLESVPPSIEPLFCQS